MKNDEAIEIKVNKINVLTNKDVDQTKRHWQNIRNYIFNLSFFLMVSISLVVEFDATTDRILIVISMTIRLI